MTHSKYLVLQAGLHLCQLATDFTAAEARALLVDQAFRDAAAAMDAACLADDILATKRYCTCWWQAGLAAMQRERGTA